MPTASPRPAALVRRVVFVDGVRTPFGRARKDGLYAHTRADNLSVKTVQNHVSSLLAKTGTRSRAELVARARDAQQPPA